MTKLLQIHIGCMMLQLELNTDSLSQWFQRQAFIHSVNYLSSLASASESKRLFFPNFLTFLFKPFLPFYLNFVSNFILFPT